MTFTTQHLNNFCLRVARPVSFYFIHSFIFLSLYLKGNNLFFKIGDFDFEDYVELHLTSLDFVCEFRTQQLHLFFLLYYQFPQEFHSVSFRFTLRYFIFPFRASKPRKKTNNNAKKCAYLYPQPTTLVIPFTKSLSFSAIFHFYHINVTLIAPWPCA